MKNICVARQATSATVQIYFHLELPGALLVDVHLVVVEVLVPFPVVPVPSLSVTAVASPAPSGIAVPLFLVGVAVVLLVPVVAAADVTEPGKEWVKVL